MSEMSHDLEARIAAKALGDGAPLDDDENEDVTAGEDDSVPDERATDDETSEDASDDAHAPLVFGKYKTLEEAERAFGQLESKLGEQGSELGQTRQRLEQIEQQLQQAPRPQYDAERLDEWLDENVMHVPQLAEEARKRGDTALYEAAMEKWFDVSPRQAAAYERRVEMHDLRVELTTQTAEQTAPAQALQAREAQQMAVAELTKKFDDFAEVLGGMDEDAIGAILTDPLFPSEILSQIDPGDAAGQEKLLGTLYAFAKTRQVGPISEAAQTAAREAVEADRNAKRDGTLPSSKGSGKQAKPPPPELEVKNDFRRAFGLPLLEQ